MIKEIKHTDHYSAAANFNIKEFFSNSLGVESHPFDFALIEVAQAIRDKYGVVVVNSTYRSHLHNMAVGGSVNSRHLDGFAMDLRVQRYDGLLKDLEINGLGLKEFKGFITECVVYDTFIHLATSNKNQPQKPIINKLKKKTTFIL
jgi:uncharacterized protein YcbK (DUF882 family)